MSKKPVAILDLKQLKNLLVSLSKKLPTLMAAYIASQMKKGSKKDKPYFRTSDKLTNQSGELWKSFFQSGKSNVSKFNMNNFSIEGVFGTDKPYASVQEKGMFVHSKGKMHKYFWAMYYQTKYEWYKQMALSVLSKGGINIKARPFFEPAMKEFKEDGIPKIINTLFMQLGART